MALPDDTRGRWVICKLTRASRIGMSATRCSSPSAVQSTPYRGSSEVGSQMLSATVRPIALRATSGPLARMCGTIAP
jgi:hypothetical protein